MNETLRPAAFSSPMTAAYAKDGFFFPYDMVSQAEAAEILADLEAGEAETAADRAKLSMLRGYPARLLPSFDRLIRHPRLIAAVSQLIGSDLLVWGSGLFIKDANSKSFVSWHQDLNYWGLDGANEVTAWVALTPATVENGCMRFLPGSHKHDLVAHVDSFAQDNLLTRGQEIAVKVDEANAVDVVMRAGQASFHHGHMYHASGPNRTSARRVATAIRYVATSMKQKSGDKLLVSHVSGNDRYGHFNVVPSPAGRLLEEDFERVRRDVAIKRSVLYAGVPPDRVKQDRRG
jgi:ectoine hydroxylase-related dioxygenase (phytanoyl-CoA dioxygenase family)